MEVEKFNPMEMLREMKMPINHITYNPDIEPDYYIIRGQKHDGIIAFTNDLFRRALMCLINRTTFYKPDNPNNEQLKNIKYEIGDIELVSEYGNFTLREGTETQININGVDETLKIPVKCSYE